MLTRFIFVPKWAAESALRAEHSTALKVQRNSGFPNLSVPFTEVLTDVFYNLLHRSHLVWVVLLKPASRVNIRAYRGIAAPLTEPLWKRARKVTRAAYVWPSYRNNASFIPLLDAPFCLCSCLVFSIEEWMLIPRAWKRRGDRVWRAATLLLFKFVYTSVLLGWV